MSQIRKKLNSGNYTNITDMTSDLYQMIDNAKKAFPQTHKSNRDAVKMQKMLNQKLVDNAVDQDDSDMEDGDTSLPSIASASSGSALPKKKGRPKLHTTTPTTSNQSTSSSITSTFTNQPALLNPTLPMMNVNVSSASNSPKGRFPNNPLLKKKLLGLQKFLTEYTVSFCCCCYNSQKFSLKFGNVFFLYL